MGLGDVSEQDGVRLYKGGQDYRGMQPPTLTAVSSLLVLLSWRAQ